MSNWTWTSFNGDVYEIDVCGTCLSWFIRCDICSAESCHDSGCDVCRDAFEEFREYSWNKG